MRKRAKPKVKLFDRLNALVGRLMVVVAVTAVVGHFGGSRAALVAAVVALVLVTAMAERLDALLSPGPRGGQPRPGYVQAAMAQLRKWPAARAERRARAALADGESIPHVTLADGDPPAQVAALAPALRAFFGEWSEVADDESSCLAWSALGESEVRPGRIRIGHSGEDQGEYSVAPGEEAVLYVEQPYAAGGPEAEERFPSIWHVVCFMAGCVIEIAEKLEQADGQF